MYILNKDKYEKMSNIVCEDADLHFNIIVPVLNFHGLAFEAQECEAIPVHGHKANQLFVHSCMNE